MKVKQLYYNRTQVSWKGVIHCIKLHSICCKLWDFCDFFSWPPNLRSYNFYPPEQQWTYHASLKSPKQYQIGVGRKRAWPDFLRYFWLVKVLSNHSIKKQTDKDCLTQLYILEKYLYSAVVDGLIWHLEPIKL